MREKPTGMALEMTTAHETTASVSTWGALMLLRLGRVLLVAAYTAVAASLLLFSLFEFCPSLLDYVNLQPIAYYALKHELISDPTLVFLLRKVDYVLQTTWMGDQYSPEYGVDVLPMKYVATTNADGFRPNSAGPPYEIVLVGDSFLAMGEDDAASEQAPPAHLVHQPAITFTAQKISQSPWHRTEDGR